MIFANQKEETLNLELTSYGRYLLSIGRFKPHTYAFFDDDIIYDREFVSEEENELQNEIEERIQENTPRLRPQSIYRGAQVGVFSENPDFENNLMPGVIADKSKKGFSKVETPEGSYILSDPIGTSDYNSKNVAAWDIGFFKTPLESAAVAWVGKNNEVPTTFIPQLESTLRFKTKIYAPLSNSDDGMPTLPPEISDLEDETEDGLNEIITLDEDSGFLVYEGDYALLKIEEANSQFLKENFDLEVYEIISDAKIETVDGVEKNIPEVKERLFFDSYGFDREKSVDFYFDIVTDFDISEAEYWHSKHSVDKIKNIFTDKIFENPDIIKEGPQAINIYGTKENDDEGICD